MATEDEDHAAFNDDDDDDLEDTDETDMEDFDDDDRNPNNGQQLPPSPPPTTSPHLYPPNPKPNPTSTIDQSFSDFNGAVQITPISSSAGVVGTGGGDHLTRRLFQRLWTDDDEIKILKGFLEFTSSRGTTFASHQYDTGPFYEQIKNELQLDFNKNQLIEKLRRLKKKYRNTANRMASHGNRFSFKTPHEMATYEIAKKIWSASIVKSRESDDDEDLNNSFSNNNVNSNSDAMNSLSRSRRRGQKRSLDMPPVPPLPAPPPLPPPSLENVGKVEVLTAPVTATPAPIPTPTTHEVSNLNCDATVITPSIQNVIEETVRSCLSPIFKELLNSSVNSAVGGSANPVLGLKLPPLLNFGGNFEELASDERWKKQRILELEVYLKRVELVQEQIKVTLEELKGSQSELSLEI